LDEIGADEFFAIQATEKARDVYDRERVKQQ
jgi:hypothetical protein